MRNSRILAVLALSVLALATACEDDPAQPTGDSGTQTYLPLTTRDAVLSNLDTAWSNRATNRVDDLLDDNFTFYLHPADVGGSIPAHWGRADEMGTTGTLFMSNTTPSPNAPVCTSIRLDLSLDDAVWDQIPDTTSGETWHTTTVYYNFTFKMEPDQTYISEPAAQAQLTVREVATGSGTEWRLVEWRDLGNNLVAGAKQNASVQETTWGAIKALYLDYLSLATRNAVLSNLEFAWNQRSTNIIDQLLDDDLVFFFAPGDVGGSIPEQWDRASELSTAAALLNSNSVPPAVGPVCESVRVDLSLDNLQWLEIVPEDYPGEVWYTTTVFYGFRFEMYPDNTYISHPRAKAQFTVREVAVGNGTEWRLVEWRDLSGLVASLERTSNSSESTWGSIKALYK